MTLLNERYDYGLDLHLLSIDEGISGYRDASLDVSHVVLQESS
jgi:cytoplasmic tRNA 2-thiolation protein 1